MIRKVTNWRMIEQVPESGEEPDFSVIIADKELSTRPILAKLPYTGMTDTTITPETHDLYVEATAVRSNAPLTEKGDIFFRKKSTTEEGGATKNSSFQNIPASAVFGDQISTKRKAIIDESTGAAVTVSQNAAAIGVPGQEIIAGENGVTMTAGSPRIMDLPAEDHVIMQETGLLRMMPKAFIPPFCIPDFLPSLRFISQVAGTVAIFKAIRDVTRRGL